MSRKANFKIGPSSDRHNLRDFSRNYVIPDTHLEVTNPEYKPKEMITILGDLAQGLTKENSKNFQKKIQRKLKNEYKKSCADRGVKSAGNAKLTLEAIINLEEWHTKEDLEKLSAALENELGIKMLYMVAHFDEGHEAKNGEIKINSHAHFKFTPLVNGKITRRDKFWASKAQDICARELGMERGESVKISGKKGMSHRAYRQSKRNEDEAQKKTDYLEEKLTETSRELDEIKQEICEVAEVSDFQEARKIMKESGKAKAADYSILKKMRDLGVTPEQVLEFALAVANRESESDIKKIPTEEIIKELDTRPLNPDQQSWLLRLAKKKFKQSFNNIYDFLVDKFGGDKTMARDDDMQKRFKHEFEKQKSEGKEAPQESRSDVKLDKPTVTKKKRR